MDSVTLRVPASSSNLGPGFDCLGVALRLYNNVTVARVGAARPAPILREAAAAFFRAAKVAAFPFSCAISGDVPRSRGLGSSVTVRLGLLHGLNFLAGKPLPREEIFQLCAQLEGHPDNAAPAEFGGFTIAREKSFQRFPVSPTLKFVLLIPEFEIRTAGARRLLPRKISHHDAVVSSRNACAIAGAFAASDYAQLRGAFEDHLHQPYRKKLLPFFDNVVGAAENAGALGAFLSGSGSTIAAVTLQDAAEIGRAMLGAIGQVRAAVKIVTADNRGAHLVRN